MVFGFCGCHSTGIGLVLVSHFPENDISNKYPLPSQPGTPAPQNDPHAVVFKGQAGGTLEPDDRQKARALEVVVAERQHYSFQIILAIDKMRVHG